jgi:hypothetical protein
MKRYVIEHDIQSRSEKAQLRVIKTSNSALENCPHVQWDHSYVAANKTFCVYLAENETAIRKHAELSGFPATVITEISTIIDPTTASSK